VCSQISGEVVLLNVNRVVESNRHTDRDFLLYFDTEWGQWISYQKEMARNSCHDFSCRLICEGFAID